MIKTEPTSLPILEAKVKEIIQLGKSWGMSDADIQECLDASVTDEDIFQQPMLSAAAAAAASNTELSKPGSAATFIMQTIIWVWWFLKHGVCCCLLVFVGFAVLYSSALVVSSFSPSFEHAFAKSAANLVYPSMRLARILLKPLADTFDIADVYSADCLVNNPFFFDPIEDCQPCRDIREFMDMTGQSPKTLHRKVEEIRPFVYRGYVNSPIQLTDLQKMYFENERRFSFGGSRTLKSNLDNVYNISDFFHKYNNEDLLHAKNGVGHVNWETNDVPSSQAIRKIFPRLTFIESNAEVSLLKRIIIEGPLASRHELPIGGFVNSWYLQAFGSRRVTLVPHPECVDDCRLVSTTLHAGDLAFFQDQFWRLLSEPVIDNNGGPVADEISIAYSSSFTV